MSKFGFVGPSYTARSNAVADEECINFYAETLETPGAQTQRSYFGTPGLLTFAAFPDGPVRGQCWTGDRLFVASYDSLYEVFADGTTIKRMDGTLDVNGGPVSIAASNIELLIVAGGRAWCYELAGNTFIDVTAQLVGGPIKVKYSDGYFIVIFAASNKFQISAILDGRTWPGIQVNAVSVFPENIVSIEVSHRELWVFGSQHAQPYQDTGTDEIFDVIPGALIEMGIAATFACDRVDNTVFWISEDERGARQAWRASGYTPQRISTHAVETSLSSFSADSISKLVSYSYQDAGHLFWVLYVPNTDCTWVYDVGENLWHKRAEWDGEGSSTPDRYEYTNATGQVWMLEGRPLDLTAHVVQWTDFALPLGKTLPPDAVIQGIYPVMIASAPVYAISVQNLAYLGIVRTGFNHPFNTQPVLPGSTFPSTEFYSDVSIGTSLSDLAGRYILAQLDCSIFHPAFIDNTVVTAVAFAIDYTSATPDIDPQIPPPFAVPAGHGLVFAVPATVTTNTDPNVQGMATITSSLVSGGVATLTYETIFGPVPTAGQGIRLAGLTGGAGGLIGFQSSISTATGGATGSFTIPTGAPNSPLTTENGAACTLAAGGIPENSTGAAGGTAATAMFIPGVEHVPTFSFGPHRSWNHVYAFGKHLVGDWKSGNLYEMKLAVDNNDGTYGFVTDNGNLIRRVRRSPKLVNEMEWVYHAELTVDFATGLGPQPQLTDGDGNPRPPQAMLRWSNNRGSTWSNQHIANCGFAGEYNTRVIWRRLGRSRYRVYEVSVSDPIPWAIVDAYLRAT